MAANSVLRETSWFHAANLIWLYDATGTGNQLKSAIKSRLQVEIESILPKQQYQLINKGSQLVFLLPENKSLYQQKSKDSMRLAGEIISEESLPATESDLALPASQIAEIKAVLKDPAQVYNPRYFSLAVNSFDPDNLKTNAVALYQNAAKTPVSKSGFISGYITSEDKTPQPWLIIEVNIQHQDNLDTEDINESRNWTLYAQTNKFGDFVIPLDILPADESQGWKNEYSVRIKLFSCAMEKGFPDLDKQSADPLSIVYPNPDSSETEIQLAISFGQKLRLHSPDSNALIVKL
jgi:hypothetical protein